jgi:predicted RNase H-like HicB family nuclease
MEVAVMVTRADQSELPKDGAMPQAEEFEVLLLSCSDESGYAVLVPARPDCASQGEDWDEALEWVQDAIETFLDFAERPQVDATDEKERLIRDWVTQGYVVGTAYVFHRRRNRFN